MSYGGYAILYHNPLNCKPLDKMTSLSLSLFLSPTTLRPLTGHKRNSLRRGVGGLGLLLILCVHYQQVEIFPASLALISFCITIYTTLVLSQMINLFFCTFQPALGVGSLTI